MGDTDGCVGVGSSPSSPEPLPLNGASSEPPGLTAAAAVDPAKDCSISAMVNMRLRPRHPHPVSLVVCAHHLDLTLVIKWREVAESGNNLLRVEAAINSSAAAQSSSFGPG